MKLKDLTPELQSLIEIKTTEEFKEKLKDVDSWDLMLLRACKDIHWVHHLVKFEQNVRHLTNTVEDCKSHLQCMDNKITTTTLTLDDYISIVEEALRRTPPQGALSRTAMLVSKLRKLQRGKA